MLDRVGNGGGGGREERKEGGREGCGQHKPDGLIMHDGVLAAGIWHSCLTRVHVTWRIWS